MHPNPLFKPASSDRRPKRSPSPPKRFVEPLSPTRPRPVEPNYNYPAINSHVDFAVRPDQPCTATPKSRNRSASYRHTHHRTPSTIDTLAEAALAVSPSLEFPHGHSHGYPMPSAYGGSEPPHKRSRSEMLPSPTVGQFASRPATSYQHMNGWYRDPTQQQNSGHPYDSRLEEASLLLNFRTGGWPNNSPPPPLPLPKTSFASVPRPHANSFPQSTRQPCPAELAGQAGLLPAFNPQDGDAPRPTLPSPQQTVEESPRIPAIPAPEFPQNVAVDPVASSALRPSRTEQEKPDVPQRIATRNEKLVSRAGSTEVTVSETSEGAPKPKRATQKTKSRGLSSRKSIAEKAATKRAAARKKTPDPSKASRTASEAPQASEVDRNRRKSVSDVPFNCETSVPNERQGKRAISVPRDIPMILRPASTVKTSKRDKNATETVICAGCATTRETSSRNGEMDEWVSCNGCKKWFHVDCAGFKKAIEVRDVDKYFCPKCEPVHGKTTYVRKSTRAHASVDYAELQRGVLKTSEESMEHHYIQPIKDGTFRFDPEYFPRMRPELVTRDFFEKSSAFVEPICIPAEWNPRPWLKNRRDTDGNNNNVMKNGADDVTSDTIPDEFEYDAVADEGQDKLDMVMPEDLTVRQVCNLVGPHTPLDVIDVKTQNSGAKWDLGRWADYYEGVSDDKPILNVISLEVSQTKLGRMLRRPKVVRDIDLQDQVWPRKETDAGKYPKVQYYCLMSVEDSYTDFHIDFGGSSVYYHILKGKKTFFFIPPKPKHLKAYEEWNDSPEQNFTFLPNITKECYRVDLSEGDTMLIPSGWIHAVWTPETSLVIGGNFLTQMSYKNQFRVVEIEKANHTPMKFRYPFFQKIMWYNVIKYLTDDPLPEAVSQLFYSGHTFERQTPVWADFDGEIASQDERPEAKNARYYGEAEIEGLPDLLNYIFRTVMLVNGRIEGVSADQQKRVNASIPKGHGEPLEVAKTFALWTAWKRGNEYPPAWAHPDAVLPSKEEGPPKKLSARALKDMERKEAFAALKANGPDRKSERVKKSASANAANSTSNMASSTPDHHPSPIYPPPHHQLSTQTYAHQDMDVQALPAAQPMAFMMNAMPGQHISTPKTSVLGPKRVACDQCRRRRIRCKHKDLVTQVTPNQMQQASGGFGAHDSPQVYDNITVTPPKSKTSADPFTNQTDEQPGLSGHSAQNGTPLSNGMNGTTFPMTVNGVPVFTDATRRGRSKACFECRKSKRRCIHDENGNVDPIKAAETPVPRGSASSKKRASDENTRDSPVPLKKKMKTSPVPNGLPAMPSLPHDQKLPDGAVQPHGEPPNGYQHSPAPPQHSPSHTTVQAQSTEASYQPPTLYHQECTRHLPQEQHQPPLDPSLFGYPDPASSSYVNQNYAYPSSDRSGPYQLPSLEQIANEVLDMNGRSHEDYHTFTSQEQRDPATVSNGFTEATRPDESVDSAISIPGSDDGKHQATKEDDTMTATQSMPDGPVQTSVEASHAIKTDAPTSEAQTSPNLQKSSVNDLPLYKPPAPLSLSPEVSKRQPHPTNGIVAEPSAPVKRKRDSVSSTPGSKKPRTGSVEPVGEQDVQSLELAKSLQQDDLGLRKRSK